MKKMGICPKVITYISSPRLNAFFPAGRVETAVSKNKKAMINSLLVSCALYAAKHDRLIPNFNISKLFRDCKVILLFTGKVD